MIRALVLTERNFDTWYSQYLAGEAIAPLPYGIQELENHGFRLAFARRTEHPPWRKPRDVIEHRTGVLIERALRGVRAAAEADIVIALLEQQGYAAAIAKRCHLPPYASTPLVIWTCWLADELLNASTRRRKQLLGRVAGADLLTYFGRRAGEVFDESGVAPDRTVELTWGVTDSYFTPGDQDRDIDVLAVGQDRGRDYRTLLAAFEGLDLTLDLVCKTDSIENLRIPRNVRVHGTVSMSAYRRLLQRARIVAVPTRELVYPTGSSVALEAAASGCAVVVSATAGLRAYFDDRVNGRLVPVGDVEGWRTVLSELHHDVDQRTVLGLAARDRVQRENSSAAMWREFATAVAERGLTGWGHE